MMIIESADMAYIKRMCDRAKREDREDVYREIMYRLKRNFGQCPDSSHVLTTCEEVLREMGIHAGPTRSARKVTRRAVKE